MGKEDVGFWMIPVDELLGMDDGEIQLLFAEWAEGRGHMPATEYEAFRAGFNWARITLHEKIHKTGAD